MTKRKSTEKAPKYLLPSDTLTATQRRIIAGGDVYTPRKRQSNEATSMTFGNCTTQRDYRTGDGDPFHQVVRPGAERAYALPSKGLEAKK